ncbi:PD-(D/E)XK motif protein [Candidatus Poribacteria bacterium]|nr:PD-(D/E)XK motif protein [Candidatus Poribacteria bacterium]
MIDLVKLFSSIRPIVTTNDDRFAAHPIPSYESHRLGKDGLNRPILLISTLNDRNYKQPPIVLEHLRVQYNLNCGVLNPNGTIEDGKFTIVRCTGEDTTLQFYFLNVASDVVLSLKDQPTQSEVENAVNRLIELFRAMEEVPLKSIQGLWAEMFLILQAGQPNLLVNAWHTLPEDRYDFAMSNQRIEVKSFSGENRQHHFSLEQLHPPKSVNALIGSVCVEGSQAGLTITDLREKLHIRLENNFDSLLHIDSIIARTLGNAWQQASEIRFDQRVAEDSLCFFLSSLIPSVDPNLPQGVSQVHFKSDLTDMQPVDDSLLLDEGGIFAATQCNSS